MHGRVYYTKLKRKAQGVTQSQVEAISCHQEEEERDANHHAQNKQTQTSTPTSSLFTKRVDAMLKGLKKKKKEQKARQDNIYRLVELTTRLQSKSNTRATLERSVV